MLAIENAREGFDRFVDHYHDTRPRRSAGFNPTGQRDRDATGRQQRDHDRRRPQSPTNASSDPPDPRHRQRRRGRSGGSRHTYKGAPESFLAEVRASGIRATVAAPTLVDGALWGAFVASSRSEPSTAEAKARLGAFAELLAHAVADVDARLKLKRDSFAVKASAASRRMARSRRH